MTKESEKRKVEKESKERKAEVIMKASGRGKPGKKPPIPPGKPKPKEKETTSGKSKS